MSIFIKSIDVIERNLVTFIIFPIAFRTKGSTCYSRVIITNIIIFSNISFIRNTTKNTRCYRRLFINKIFSSYIAIKPFIFTFYISVFNNSIKVSIYVCIIKKGITWRFSIRIPKCTKKIKFRKNV